MDNLFFLAAFYSSIWLFYFAVYWAFVPGCLNERKILKKRYEAMRHEVGLTRRIHTMFFVAVNAHLLFPVRGIAICVSIITLWIVTI